MLSEFRLNLVFESTLTDISPEFNFARVGHM